MNSSLLHLWRSRRNISNYFGRAILCLLLSGFQIAVAQQTGYIRGTVKTADGKPAEYVNITLEGTSRGTTVNRNGSYSLGNIPTGSYTVVASFTGLQTQKQAITIAGEGVQTINFTLSESRQALKEVIISTNKVNKYTRQSSDDVAKLPIKNMENPQVYNVVTNELMRDQQTITIGQALSNVPGAVLAKDPAGGSNFTMRGFTTQVTLRNGLPFVVAGRSSVDPVNVDYFEALRGPSAVMFGNQVSSYGGAINMVTKKPFDEFKGDVSFYTGSYGLNRLTADINTPLNKDRTVLLRTNAAINKEKSFLEHGHNNTATFAPSLVYKVNDRLTLSVDMEIYKEDLTRVQFLNFAVLGVDNLNKIPLDFRSMLYNDDLNAVTNTFRTYVQAAYKISDQWTSQTNISVNNENVDHSYQYYPRFLDATHIRRDVSLFGPINTNTSDFQHNLRGDFHIGSIRNRMVWGLEYTYLKTDFTYNSALGDTIDITKNNSPFTRTMADAALAKNKPSLYPKEYNIYATYLSDLVNITDNLMVMLSGRLDRYELKGDGGYGQTSFSPKLGLVYQPVRNHVSIFGNYMSGFTNKGATIQPDGSNVVLQPEFANQLEGGVKVDVLNSRLSATVSYYDISIDNAVRTDGNNYQHQDGKQKSKGFEVSVNANPVQGLNITAGYSNNENKYIFASSNNGKTVTGAPKNVANGWVSYKFQETTALEGFGVGLGVNYADKSFYDIANTITIPAFTTMNASIFYDKVKWRAGISTNNLTNTHYWAPSSIGAVAQLRQVVANVTIRF